MSFEKDARLIWFKLFNTHPVYFLFQLGEWFENVFSHLAKIPRYLVPCYFDAVVTGAFVVLRQHAFSLMSE